MPYPINGACFSSEANKESGDPAGSFPLIVSLLCVKYSAVFLFLFAQLLFIPSRLLQLCMFLLSNCGKNYLLRQTQYILVLSCVDKLLVGLLVV